jgi:hypothetical protein
MDACHCFFGAGSLLALFVPAGLKCRVIDFDGIEYHAELFDVQGDRISALS